MALDIEQLDKPIRKVRKILYKMPTEPSPDQVHDLRTNSRRLEAVLEATDPDRNGRKILKQISKVRKKAGKVRDVDVLTAYATELPHDGDEESCSIRLLEHLGAVRHKNAKKLRKTAQQLAPDLRKRLKRVSQDLQNRVKQRQADQSRTSTRITSAALELVGELERPTSLNETNLHPYRLKVKELRNLLRLAEAHGDESFLETLCEVKDAIGEWHDWVELEAIAKKALDHDQCRLMRELKKKSRDRFERALALTDRMRGKYLRTSKNKASQRRPPTSDESVWSATAALSA